MNENNSLILINNEDKSESVDSCIFREGKWEVKFVNTNKVYKYNPPNVVKLSSPKIIDHTKHIVYESDLPISGIICILDFGTYIKLLFKTGYKKVYLRTNLIIEQTSLSNKKANNCFEYFKTIANQMSKYNEDNSQISKQLSSLTTISPRSVLSAYIERKPIVNEQMLIQAIFPFGFNDSQKLATEKALAGQVSVIEGPPGTGKTQTILNIIANAVINRKTVAVVSNNNSAIANVLEKLEREGLDFFVALLGNNENKEKFFSEQTGEYPAMTNWLLEETEYEEIKMNLRNTQELLNKMLAAKNKLALLKQELSELEIEYKYYNQYYSEFNLQQPKLKSFFPLSSDKIMKILVEFRNSLSKGKTKIIDIIYNLIAYGIYDLNIYKYPVEIQISYIQKTYYELKTKEVKVEISKIANKLDKYNFDKEMKTYSENSMKLFKGNLATHYGKRDGRKMYEKDVLWKNFDHFIKDYPVILSTTHSLRYSAANNYLFDYVLIDEASQVDIVTGALALSRAKNAVIVGDLQQLPNVVPTDIREITMNIFNSFNIDQAYNYAEQSLLSSVMSLYKDIPKTMLKEHYRCHPKIIGFCNQKFYNNELIVLTEENTSQMPLLLYKTVKGNHARRTVNQRQIDVIFNEIIPNQNLNVKEKSLGIITPFRLQANEFLKTIKDQNIKADTVHKFQGQEKDIIILSTVSNEINVNDFADNPNLLNVAVSRAVEQLIVVVAEESESWQGTNIGDLVRYIRYNNFEVIESRVYSVFDLLYRSYSKKLLEVRQKRKKVSDFESENLMNFVIEKVLEQDEFKVLNHIMHLPLKMLIKNRELLSDDERIFTMNLLTHVDFVIFNKIDKMPVLVIEVDGYSFHANNPKQLIRDKMKDRILQKYSIPIIRMKTTGSEEEKVIRKRLLELLMIS